MAMSSATSNSNRVFPAEPQRAQPAPETRDATVVTHSCPRGQRQRHRSLVPGLIMAGVLACIFRFSTNCCARSGRTSARDFPGLGLRLVLLILAGAQTGQPDPLRPLLTIVDFHSCVHVEQRHWQRHVEFSARVLRVLPGRVTLAINSTWRCGHASAALLWFKRRR